MYVDTSKVRDRRMSLSLNDEEYELIMAAVNYSGGERARVIREMVLEHAVMILDGEVVHADNHATNSAYNEGAENMLKRTSTESFENLKKIPPEILSLLAPFVPPELLHQLSDGENRRVMGCPKM